MSDPTRLLHDHSDADALERALLESLSDVGPSEHDKAAVWRDVSAGLLAAGVFSGSAGAAASVTAGASAKLTAASAAASVLPKALLLKVAVLIALSGAGAGGIVLYQRSAQEQASSPRRAGEAAPTNAPFAPTAVVNESSHDVAQPEPAQAEPQAADTCRGAHCTTKARAKASPAADTLARESALLSEARSALRGGDVAAAEAALARLTRSFPRAVLAQESEVLAIELLLARDQDAAARARAARFIAEHPESPHSAKLERLLR